MKMGHLDTMLVCSQFLVPLEAAGVDISAVQDERDDIVDYAKRYLDIIRQDYRVIWLKIFADTKKWTNVFSVIEVLFFCQ